MQSAPRFIHISMKREKNKTKKQTNKNKTKKQQQKKQKKKQKTNKQTKKKQTLHDPQKVDRQKIYTFGVCHNHTECLSVAS